MDFLLWKNINKQQQQTQKKGTLFSRVCMCVFDSGIPFSFHNKNNCFKNNNEQSYLI